MIYSIKTNSFGNRTVRPSPPNSGTFFAYHCLVHFNYKLKMIYFAIGINFLRYSNEATRSRFKELALESQWTSTSPVTSFIASASKFSSSSSSSLISFFSHIGARRKTFILLMEHLSTSSRVSGRNLNPLRPFCDP